MTLTRIGLHYADCNGGQALSLVAVWDQAGAGTKLTGLTTTTWYRSGIAKEKTMIKLSAYRRTVIVFALAGGFGAGGAVLSSVPASAGTISFTPNATLNVGQGRYLVGDWAGAAPFKVDFRPNTPGNSNVLLASTRNTELLYQVYYSQCSGYVGTHVLKV